MRFAYIDSQGKEVAIPTVDALRLRIALRAIVEDTEFYDAASERWGPAREHDIFRTLRKELDEQEGDAFVATPPAPARSGAAPEDPTSPSVDGLSGDEALEVEELDVPDQGEGQDDEDEEWRFAISNAPTDRPDPGTAPGTPTADPPAASPEDATPLGTSSWLDLDGDEGSADFDLDDAHFHEEDEEDSGDGELLLVPEMGGPAPAEPEPDDLVLDEVPEFLEPTHLGDAAPGSGGAAADPPPLQGLSQDRFEADASLDEVGWGDEPPPSTPADEPAELEVEFDDEPPVSPASRPAPAGPADADDLPVPTREEILARRAEGARPAAARPRPGPPPRPRQRSSRGVVLVGVVALVAVVGGGGWWFLNRPADTEAVADELPPAPPVAIPDLPASLEPRMRTLAEAARQETLEGLRELPAQASVPAEPDPAWLAGVYLANASQYPSVPEYWEAIDRFLRVMQAAEDSLFSAALARNLSAAALPADTAALLEERILAGFRATARDRGVIYQRARTVSEASLHLHSFLLENEASIDYEPGVGGISADPVLEAIPATAELGDEMWDRVGDITEAMDALDFLDRVTTERLVDAVILRLSDISVR